MLKILLALLVLTIVVELVCRAQVDLPEVQIEGLKSGKLRVAVPDVDGITLFTFHAKINVRIRRQERGTYFKEAKSPNGDFWILTFDMPLSDDDTVYYWISLIINNTGYVIDDYWPVEDLRDSFTPLKKCDKSVSVSNNAHLECVGEVIFSDDFGGSRVDDDKWTIEHRIPTYYGRNDLYEFNSYEDLDETRFIKNGILYLKPVARENREEVYGVLDLRDRCTSHDHNQCYHKQNRVYIVPPVKSGRITSKLSFQYGKIEIKAKLPAGDWIIPLIQLQLNEDNNYSESPKVLIAYSRGNLHLCGTGNNDIGSNWLYGGPVLTNSSRENRAELLKTRFSDVPFNSGFHVYTLEWRPGMMSFYVDSNFYGEVVTNQGFPEYKPSWNQKDAPFNKEYFLSLGVAVGGLFDFPNNCSSGDKPKPWSNSAISYVKDFFEARNSWLDTWIEDNVALQIDYIKVWSV